MGKKMGRTKCDLDWNKIGYLLQCGCKTIDIANSIGVREKTLYDRCETDLNMKYTIFSQENKKKGENLLREAQFKNAMTGNTSMQIWLGKNRLGQADKVETINQYNLSDFKKWCEFREQDLKE